MWISRPHGACAPQSHDVLQSDSQYLPAIGGNYRENQPVSTHAHALCNASYASTSTRTSNGGFAGSDLVFRGTEKTVRDAVETVTLCD